MAPGVPAWRLNTSATVARRRGRAQSLNRGGTGASPHPLGWPPPGRPQPARGAPRHGRLAATRAAGRLARHGAPPALPPVSACPKRQILGSALGMAPPSPDAPQGVELGQPRLALLAHARSAGAGMPDGAMARVAEVVAPGRAEVSAYHDGSPARSSASAARRGSTGALAGGTSAARSAAHSDNGSRLSRTTSPPNPPL